MATTPPASRRTHTTDSWDEFDYQPPPSPRRHLSVEEALLVAVLHRALLDYALIRAYQTGEARAPRDMHELDDAVRWVHSDSSRPFSFEYCCWRGLGQDPALIRETVSANWRRLLCREAALIFHMDTTYHADL